MNPERYWALRNEATFNKESLEQATRRRDARLRLRAAMLDAHEEGVSFVSMAQLALKLEEEQHA